MTKHPKKPAEHIIEQYRGLKPFAGLLGFFNKDIKSAFKDVESQFKDFQKLQLAMEKFKVRFGPHGWTIFDSISSTHLLESLATDENSISEAILIDYFLQESELEHLGYKFNSEKYGIWKSLYDTAAERILAGDYISSVPLIFIIIDGICLKFFQRHPFSGVAEKEIFDTYTSGPDALEKAYALLGSKRRKVNDDEVFVPYRHGIMHGIDTNYGHKIVVAKAVNILRATIDYVNASDSESSRIEKAVEEQTPPNWTDVIESLKRNAEFKEAIASWNARNIVEGLNLASFGTPYTFELNSPEAAAADYLNFIVAKNYGALAEASMFWTKDSIGKRAGSMRNDFNEFDIKDWTITGYEDTAAAATNVTATVSGLKMGELMKGEIVERCIYQSSTNQFPLTRGMAGGKWYVIPNIASAIWQLGNEN